MHQLLSKVALGTLPDWIAAIGSVLAFAGLIWTLVWERAKHRQERIESDRERRDNEALQARLVFSSLGDGSANQTRLTVKNRGAGPIFVESVDLLRADGGARRISKVDRRHPTVDDLGPGDDGTVWLWLAAEEPDLAEAELIWIRLTFMDMFGRRWTRDDDEQPVRLLIE